VRFCKHPQPNTPQNERIQATAMHTATATTTKVILKTSEPKSGRLRLSKALRALLKQEHPEGLRSTPRASITFRTSRNHWEPKVERADTIGGIEAVRVQLFGKHAKGACMTLDLADWLTIKDRYGIRYFLASIHGGAYRYVCSQTRRAGAASGRPCGGGGPIARLIVGAQPGQVVRYRDGNPLNLKRSNLVLLTKKEAKIFKKEHVN
jgi:hypothetical protein